MELLTKNEYAYRRLHDDILSGKLPSGSRLIVKDLVEEYQVSAMPVKCNRTFGGIGARTYRAPPGCLGL